MEAFFVAGCAEDPDFAEAELLGDYLTKSFPRVGFTKDMRHACEWPEFRQKLTQLHGFACPGSSAVVWRRDGRLVGGTADFKRVLKDMYNLELESDKDLIAAIAAENAQSAAAAAESDTWTPYIGSAKKKWQDGLCFDGVWKNHQPIKGVVTFKDGATYTGALKDGKFHGHGKRHFPNGAKFIGSHAEGRREGMGKYTDPQGNVYDGLYSRGICHGKGRRTWAPPVISGQFGDNTSTQETGGREFVGEWTRESAPLASGHGVETIPIKVLVNPPDLDRRPPWADPNRVQAGSWFGRYQGCKPVYIGSLKGKYVNGHCFNDIRGIVHPREDGVYIFAVHDGSGDTKLVGAKITMEADHHRIATGLIDLTSESAVIAAYDNAKVGPFQGQQHPILNLRKAEPVYIGSLKGKYVNGHCFNDIRGIVHPREDGVFIFAVHDGSGDTKLVGAKITMEADHHRIATGLIDLTSESAVIAAYDNAKVGPFQGQQHPILNLRKAECQWEKFKLPRLARHAENLTGVGDDKVGLFEIQGVIQGDSVEFTKSYRKSAYDHNQFSATYGADILEEYASMVSAAIIAGTIQEAATVEATAFTSTEGGFLSAGGINKFAKWVVDLSVDDFDISTDFKVEQIAETAISFDLWSGEDQCRIGLDGKGNSLFREGASWGEDAKMDSGLDRTPLRENSIHTLRLLRTAGRLAVFFDGVPIPGWQSLRLENPITAIGWRPWRNTMHIQTLKADTKLSIRFEGTVADGQLAGVYTLPVEYGAWEGNFELKVGHALDHDPGCFIKGIQGDGPFPESWQLTREQAVIAVERYSFYVSSDMQPGPDARSRKLTEGQWDDLPFGLSYHSGGSMDAYFNTNSAGQNNGEYTPIGIAPSGRVIGRFIKGEQGEGPFPESFQVQEGPVDAMKAQAIEAVAALVPLDEEQTRKHLQLGDYEYFYAEEKLTWDQHAKKAREWGGCIASIMSKAENDLVLRVALAAGHKEEIWLGGKHRDFKDEIVVTTEGLSGVRGTADHWKWMDSPWSYTNWGADQPSSTQNTSAEIGELGEAVKDRVMMLSNGVWCDAKADAEVAAVYKKMRWKVHSDDSIVPFASPSTLPPFGISFQSAGDFAAHYSTNRARINDGKYTPVGILPASFEPVFNDSKRIYNGEFKNGDYHGVGTMEYETGDFYKGEWVGGQRQGHGIYSWAGVSLTFDGFFDCGVPKHGVLRFQDGINTYFPGEIKFSGGDWRTSIREAAFGDGDEDPGWLCSATQREPLTETYDEYPIQGTHNSVMARVLDRTMWDKLHSRLTCNGVTLQSCIAPGLEPKNTAHPLGLRASDPDCYIVFRELFDGVLGCVHEDFDPLTAMHPSDIDSADCNVAVFAPVAMEVMTSWILQIDRNIGSFPCAKIIDLESRRRVEEVVVSALLKMGDEDDSLLGEYWPLEGSNSYAEKMGGMSATETETLRAAGALFQESDCSDTRDWPDGRGVFMTSDNKLIVHVNKENHLSFLCLGEPDKNCIQMREMFQAISKSLAVLEFLLSEEEELTFARSENLGFLLTSLEKIGTGMTAHVTVDLPKLTKRQSIDLLAEKTGLVVSNIHLPIDGKKAQLQSMFQLSVPQKLGVSETKILNTLIEGANELSKHEKSLVGGRRRLWLLEQSPKVLLIGANEVLADDVTHASRIAQRFGLDLITPMIAVKAEMNTNSKLGQRAKWYLMAGKPVPREVARECIMNMFRDRQTQQAEGRQSQGWVCSGFPASPDEVQLLVQAEIKPNKIISLKPDDTAVAKVTSRLLSRRREKTTRRVFYLEDEPASREGEECTSGIETAQGAFPSSPGAWLHSLRDEHARFEKLSEDRGRLPGEAAASYKAGYDKLYKVLAKLGHVDETIASKDPADTSKAIDNFICAIDHNKQLITNLTLHSMRPTQDSQGLEAPEGGVVQIPEGSVPSVGGKGDGSVRPQTARGHDETDRPGRSGRPKTAGAR